GSSLWLELIPWRANHDVETTDWRAVCGRTARTVRREGRARAFLYPYQVSSSGVVSAAMKVRINAMRLQKGCASVTRHRQSAAHGFDQRESGKKDPRRHGVGAGRGLPKIGVTEGSSRGTGGTAVYGDAVLATN
ncbi:MAG: hypothetical protein Q8J96_16290, partial [Rhodocyclaceae bacterium]|nr:hypothetical protein [Rhodocyclaceae bacterium]